MKKLLTVIVMTALVVSGSFAAKKSKSNVNIEASAGFAYGFSDIFYTDSDANTKTDNILNSLGLKAEGTMFFTDVLGIQLDTAFLWPVSSSTQITNLNNGNTNTTTTNADSGAFVFNGFIGPVYKIALDKNFDLKIGIGFDLAAYTYTYSSDNVNVSFISPKSGKITNSYLNFGVGATVDATYKLDKNMGLKFGVTGAFLWGSQYNTHRQANDGSWSQDSTTNTNTNAFYIIPDISFVYKF